MIRRLRHHLLVAVGAGAWSLASATVALADLGDGRYLDHHSMMGWGGWFFGPVMMVIFFALLVAAGVLIVRLAGLGSPRSGNPQADRSSSILRERFAKGEISREEFEEAKKVLEEEDHEPPRR